jgi:hypothetical protein|tara:strand:+ start:1899 stop:2033 length:135 start_codon:yes stop_codon:yes gene_type:complete
METATLMTAIRIATKASSISRKFELKEQGQVRIYDVRQEIVRQI